jgi:N-hydroxyarylamine O-acetyltransferase
VTSSSVSDDLLERYLSVLGVRARAPGLEALHELVDAHVTRVPFENLSKLYFRGEPGMRLPPLARWLDSIEHHHFGGTCYANNHHFVRLLARLGYDVRLCGADMSQPDVHVVGIVRLGEREYLVDAGYGAPFHTPVPLDLTHDHVEALGEDRWVFRPRGADGRTVVIVHRAGAVRHGYSVNPAPRLIDEFSHVIDASFAPEAVFMNALLIARFEPGRSRVLRNFTLVESVGPSATHRVASTTPEGLPAAIHEHFDIPADLARVALAGVTLEQDTWS